MALNYIPAPLDQFALWLDNFASLIAATPTAYGLIAGDATAISAQNTAFQAAYVISNNPTTRTSPAVANTQAARLVAESVVRPYAVRISLNPSVSDGLKTGVGVTVRSTTPTPVPAPTTQPALSLLSATLLTHQLRYYDVSTPTSKAKPPGAIGLELWCAVGVTPAVDPDQCKYVGSFTKSPLIVTFSGGDQGKKATYFSRWVTAAGPGGRAQVGPWSDPLTLTIV